MNHGRIERDPVAELRHVFDRSFTEAPSLDGTGVHDLLDLRLGTARYALRVTELAALIADIRITPVATPMATLLGIAAIRGSLLPVYDLGAILGAPPASAPRWMAVAAGETPVGLAFAHFEGHLRAPAAAITAEVRSGAVHVREVVRLESGARSIVSVESVLQAIANRVSAVRGKE